jgi:hypothetical protein
MGYPTTGFHHPGYPSFNPQVFIPPEAQHTGPTLTISLPTALTSVKATPEKNGGPTLGQIVARFKEEKKSKADSSDEIEADIDGKGKEDDGEEGGEDDHDQSTGRWTKKEHELFLQALKKYGKVINIPSFIMLLSLENLCNFL